MESVNPPGVDDCPSIVTHESYQSVVVSGVEGIVVVGSNVVVVGIVVVIDRNLFNLSCRRRRRRASLSLSLLFSPAPWEVGEDALLLLTTRLLLPPV